MLLLRALEYRWRPALRAGAACFALGVVVVTASGLWVWQSLDIKAFKRSKITLGQGKGLTKTVDELRHDKNVNRVLQDLSRMVAKGDRIKRR